MSTVAEQFAEMLAAAKRAARHWRARLIGITFLGSSQWSIRSAQCCISFVREPISASGPCFL
jgi:hypothetical protein